jgi:hypothetical protein
MHNYNRTVNEAGHEFEDEIGHEMHELANEFSHEFGHETGHEYEDESAHEMHEASHELGHEAQEMGHEFQDEYEDEFAHEMHEAAHEMHETHETGHEMSHETSEVFSETMEMELASELLGVSNEAELEQFLGRLVRRAARGVRNFARSSVGRRIGGFLKTVAKKALPVVGKIAGTALGGPLGGMVGNRLGSWASNLFELELEGLSNEDKEFEIARAYVRFAGDAVRRAAVNPAWRTNPRRVALRSAALAARTFAPGLLRRRRGTRQPGFRGRQGYRSSNGNSFVPSIGSAATGGSPVASGTWFRRGRQIVINLYSR